MSSTLDGSSELGRGLLELQDGAGDARTGSAALRSGADRLADLIPGLHRGRTDASSLRQIVLTRFSYTLETLIQAGKKHMAIASVPVRTNPKTRDSRTPLSDDGISHDCARVPTAPPA